MAEVGTSRRSGANSDADRASFPDLREHVGHDPARWLDWSLMDNDDQRRLVRSLIRGLNDIATVRAWMGIERRLGRGPDDGPREQVMGWLEDREAELQTRGRADLDDWLDDQDWGEPEPTASQVVLLRRQSDGTVEELAPSARDKWSRRTTSLVPDGGDGA